MIRSSNALREVSARVPGFEKLVVLYDSYVRLFSFVPIGVTVRDTPFAVVVWPLASRPCCRIPCSQGPRDRVAWCIADHLPRREEARDRA